MAVVDAREVVEEGVVEEWGGVDGVHDCVEEGKCENGGEEEGDRRSAVKGCEANGGFGWVSIEGEQHADPVDERVDLEMDTGAKEAAG